MRDRPLPPPGSDCVTLFIWIHLKTIHIMRKGSSNKTTHGHSRTEAQPLTDLYKSDWILLVLIRFTKPKTRWWVFRFLNQTILDGSQLRVAWCSDWKIYWMNVRTDQPRRSLTPWIKSKSNTFQACLKLSFHVLRGHNCQMFKMSTQLYRMRWKHLDVFILFSSHWTTMV